MGPNNLMLGWEQPLIRDKGGRQISASIEAEIPHDLHAAAASPGREMLQRETPAGEGGWCQVAVSSGHEVINVRQHAANAVVLSSQRLLYGQVPHDLRSEQ
jgi:hypothetical protein